MPILAYFIVIFHEKLTTQLYVNVTFIFHETLTAQFYANVTLL